MRGSATAACCGRETVANTYFGVVVTMVCIQVFVVIHRALMREH